MLTEKYSALVMNPPYMGNGNMNAVLSAYINDNYVEGKADLFSTFMLLAIDRLMDFGKYGMINMHGWMFLSSFERLRCSLLDNYHIDSLLHLGPRTFDELSGEVVQNAAFIISKAKMQENGIFYRLLDGKDCSSKEKMFLNSKDFSKICYPNVNQKNFTMMPGCPFGYWLTDKVVQIFQNEESLSNIANPRKGLVTLDDNRFIHYWFEIEDNKFLKPGHTKEEALALNKKWVICNKGGGSRKWYGLNYYVLNWLNNGQELKDYIVYKYNGGSYTKEIRSESFYFKGGITWSGVTSGNPTFRIFENGCIFSSSGPSAFPTNNRNYIIGLLNSSTSAMIFKLLSPTLSVLSGDIAKVPIKYQNVTAIEEIVEDSICIAKDEWDAHETSWDFEANPLVALRNEAVANGNLDSSFKLSAFVEQFETIWEERFNQLHENEEELNRQFIDIYGLQDELSPEVPKNEITILQQGEISIEKETK